MAFSWGGGVCCCMMHLMVEYITVRVVVISLDMQRRARIEGGSLLFGGGGDKKASQGTSTKVVNSEEAFDKRVELIIICRPTVFSQKCVFLSIILSHPIHQFFYIIFCMHIHLFTYSSIIIIVYSLLFFFPINANFASLGMPSQIQNVKGSQKRC